MFIQIISCQFSVLILWYIVNKEVASVQIIDVAVPADCNVTSRRLKSGKYRNLSIELSLWKMKCEIIPIVVGCLGCVTHVLKSNFKETVLLINVW